MPRFQFRTKTSSGKTLEKIYLKTNKGLNQKRSLIIVAEVVSCSICQIF